MVSKTCRFDTKTQKIVSADETQTTWPSETSDEPALDSSPRRRYSYGLFRFRRVRSQDIFRHSQSKSKIDSEETFSQETDPSVIVYLMELCANTEPDLANKYLQSLK
jgi:hypothetical protein